MFFGQDFLNPSGFICHRTLTGNENIAQNKHICKIVTHQMDHKIIQDEPHATLGLATFSLNTVNSLKLCTVLQSFVVFLREIDCSPFL